jgi:FkbM family methyltransferase
LADALSADLAASNCDRLHALAKEQPAMKSKRRVRVCDLDLSVIDPFERTTEYIYDEIFVGRIYDHPQIKLPERATIIDVGANIGLFTIWAARKHRPQSILAYEASPTTHECLVENVARHVGSEVDATCFNLAVSREAGRELVLHQPPWVCGLSTILDGSTLPWVDELRDKGELHTHYVRSTTISREIDVQGLNAIDLLKIDVEGHFMEVLEGIAPADTAKVRNIVLEAEYVEALGHSGDSICAMLRDKGYRVEARDAAQIMIYAWRS